MAKTSSSSLPVQINEEVRHLSDYFQQILKLAKVILLICNRIFISQWMF